MARGPSAHAQLSTLLVGDKPMVGLTFLRRANVTRNGLPDHSKSLTQLKTSYCIGIAHRMVCPPCVGKCKLPRARRKAPRIAGEPQLLFHRTDGEMGESFLQRNQMW